MNNDTKKLYKYVVEHMEDILVVLKKFEDELDPDRITRLGLSDGMRRYFATLMLIKEIEGGGRGPKTLAELSDEELEVFTNNIRVFLGSVVEVLSKVPANKRTEGIALIFTVIYFIVDLGKLERGLFDHFLQCASFRTLLLQLHNEIPDASPDDTMAEISQLAVTLLSLPKADQNLMKEMILILSCSIDHLNELSKAGKLSGFVLQDSAGFFMALTKADAAERLSSFMDMTFVLDKRLIRLEFKAWINKSFKFDASDIPLVNENNRNGLIQAYRYIFESIFLYRDVRSLGYVIPEKVGPNGITPEMIEKIINHLMAADPAYLESLLIHKGNDALRSPSPDVKGVKKLAYEVLTNAQSVKDFSFTSMMKHWDDLLDTDAQKYSPAEKFAKAGKTVSDVHTDMAAELVTHMAAPRNTVGNGILLVKGELGLE